jgi:hypothetical protein
MFDGDDVDALLCLVDSVDDAKVATPGAVQTGQLQAKWLAHSARVLRHRAVGESMTAWPTLSGTVRRLRLAVAVQAMR